MWMTTLLPRDRKVQSWLLNDTKSDVNIYQKVTQIKAENNRIYPLQPRFVIRMEILLLFFNDKDSQIE